MLTSLPAELVDRSHVQRSLDINLVTDIGHRITSRNESHRRVHVRSFVQRQPSARKVKRAQVVSERCHTIGCASANHHEVTIAGNLKDMFMAIEAVGTDVDARSNIQCGSILMGKMTVAGS